MSPNKPADPLEQQDQAPANAGKDTPAPGSLPERGQASRDEARIGRDQVRKDPREPSGERGPASEPAE